MVIALIQTVTIVPLSHENKWNHGTYKTKKSDYKCELRTKIALV